MHILPYLIRYPGYGRGYGASPYPGYATFFRRWAVLADALAAATSGFVATDRRKPVDANTDADPYDEYIWKPSLFLRMRQDLASGAALGSQTGGRGGR